MTFDILTILEKLQSADADLRFMASTDLLKELQQKGHELRLDQDLERRLVASVLKKLQDSNGEVQGLAVKIVGPLAHCVREPQLEEMVSTLCTNLLTRNTEHEELRDVAGMGLKAIVADLSQVTVKGGTASSAQLVVKGLVPNLLAGIRGQDLDVKLESLEILDALLRRFGSIMSRDYDKIQEAVHGLLMSPRGAIRKRAITCLSRMSLFVSDAQFEGIVKGVLALAAADTTHHNAAAYVQAMTGITKSVGYRMGHHLPAVVKLIEGYTKAQIDDDLREICLQAYETMVLRCPKEVAPYIAQIVKECLDFIGHDPNYSVEDEDMDDESEDEEEEDEYDADYSDDDDLSWKVRRACAKCLNAVIASRPELLVTLHENVGPALIQRFREREDSVKVDIFLAYTQLIRATGFVGAEHEAAASLAAAVPSLIKATAKQLRSRAASTRVHCYQMLSTLVGVAPDTMESDDALAPLVPGIVASLSDKVSDSKLKISALSFLLLLLETYPPVLFQPHLEALANPIFHTVSDSYYKITTESLRVCSGLIKVMRPLDAMDTDVAPSVKALADKVYNVAIVRLGAQDIDQEVKDAVITCMGLIIAHFGDVMKDELKACLPVMLERLRSEITRLTAVKAFSLIAQSPRNVDIAPVLDDVVRELSTFLRKANRHLRQSSLIALDAVVVSHGDCLQDRHFTQIVDEMGPIISDADLHLSHLAISLCVTLLKSRIDSMPHLLRRVMPRCLELLKSPLLQGIALQSLLSLYVALMTTEADGPGFDVLFNGLMGAVKPERDSQYNRQSLVASAQTAAVLCIHGPANKCTASVQSFIKDISKSKPHEGAVLLALFSLGYIGRAMDLSSHKKLVPSIMAAFTTPSEEVKSAASFALGNVAVGCMRTYVPLVLSEIQSQPTRQYLLLHALKEVISLTAAEMKLDALQEFRTPILELLYEHCESKEEGTRNVVAECLGKMLLLDPEGLVQKLLVLIKDEKTHTRSTAITAIKFSITSAEYPAVDDVLGRHMAEFLALLKDPDFNVRRATLLTLNFIAHNKAGMIKEMLPTIVPSVYRETVVRDELIRKIDLGPFSHQVDDGLDLRKAAFSCMFSLLEKMPDRLELAVFLTVLTSGLKDDYDIRLLTHSLLINLCAIAPTVVVSGLNSVVDPLAVTIATRVKANAVKQEEERNADLIRSALRVVHAIAAIHDSHSSTKFADLLAQIKAGPHAEKFEALGTEADAEL